MPELPEVETVRRYLMAGIIGSQIKQIFFRPSRVVDFNHSKGEKSFLGQTIESIERKGKYLFFVFSRGSIISHLGMSGRMLLFDIKKKECQPLPKIINPVDQKDIFSDRISPRHLYWEMILQNRLKASKKIRFCFYDPRTFGKVIPLGNKDYQENERIKKLGFDALEHPIKDLYALWPLKKKPSNKNIKNYLLQQKPIAGIGNIYCDESLFVAGIRPDRKIHTLDKTEWSRLVRSFRKILQTSIKNHGTTLGKSQTDYRLPDHTYGNHQESLKIYGRKGQSCKNCDQPLQYFKITNRSTLFCPLCQK